MSQEEDTGSTSDSGLTVMYRCRHCPGVEFTAAERDTHRQTHRRENRRAASPPLTLFEPISIIEEDASRSPGPKSVIFQRTKVMRRPVTRKKFAPQVGGGTGRNRPKPIKSNKKFVPVPTSSSSGG